MRQSEFDDICSRHIRGESQLLIKDKNSHKDRGKLIKLIEECYENTDNDNEPVILRCRSLWDKYSI